MLFTFAPRTPALSVMHAIGRRFPRGDRAPAIEPVDPRTIMRLVEVRVPSGHANRTHRVARGFYISQALEIVRQ